MKNKYRICIFGLGYVGLPLAIEFGKKIETVGYDINKKRISQLSKRNDFNNDIKPIEFQRSKKLIFTNDLNKIMSCNFYIICVPTPVDKKNSPDLFILKDATNKISKVLKKGDIVVYESTVYPGVTEEVCIPILSKNSKLQLNKDFYCGYSPERINPGDSSHTLKKITKIISGSNKFALNEIYKIYNKILLSRPYKVENIRIAEAAKIIENTQRDINISLMNEFSIILNKLGINTNSVLNAAKTKWNFLDFKPGLVGGHCIGVDPYYLTYKAKKIGVDPKVILAGRKTNDKMYKFIYLKLKEKLKKRNLNFRNLNILFLGVTFKENISDTRNSQSLKLVKLLLKNRSKIDIYDPFIKEINEIKKTTVISEWKKIKKYDLIIHAVKHKNFNIFYNKKNYIKYLTKKGFIYDIHNLFQKGKNVFFL